VLVSTELAVVVLPRARSVVTGVTVKLALIV